MTTANGTRPFGRRDHTRPRPRSAVPPPVRAAPPGRETVMTSRISPAAVVTAHAQGRATLPWVPTLSRRQRRTLAARIARPSTAHHLAAARP